MPMFLLSRRVLILSPNSRRFFSALAVIAVLLASVNLWAQTETPAVEQTEALKSQTPEQSQTSPQLSTPSPVPSTTYSLEGQVFERGTKKPLTDVNLYILPAKLKATTDSQGRFRIEHVPAGESHLVINVTGYKKLDKTMEVSQDTSHLNLYVEKQSYMVFETTVSDERSKKDDAQTSLTQAEFLNMPGSGGDPVKAVQNLPGVNHVAGGSSQIVIQGSNPEDTQYEINGQNVPLIFHFGGLSSVVTPEAVESVDYLSAGYGAAYGDALGGHVGLNVREPQLDRQHGMAFMDFYNVGGLIEGPLSSDSGYLFSGRYSYIGYVLEALAKGNSDFNLTVAPVFYDLNGEYYKKLGDKEDFRLFAIMSSDELKFVLSKPVGNDPALRGAFDDLTKFYRFIPSWTKQIDHDHKVSASVGVGVDSITENIGTNYFVSNTTELTSRSEYEVQLNSLWKTTLGVGNNTGWYKVNVSVPNTFSSGGVANPLGTGDLLTTNVSGQFDLASLWWKNEVQLGENSKWTLLPGVRGDYFSGTHEDLVEPRIGLRYQVDPSLSYKILTGLYFQEPSGQQLDSTYGNPNLKSENAIHYAIGFDKDFGKATGETSTLSGSLFYKKLSNLVVNSTDLVDRNGTLTPENYNNSGWGHIYGLELISKMKLDPFAITGSYTYSVSRRQQPGMAEMPSPYDQTHSLNMLVSYTEGHWNYGTRFRYVTGSPYTPIIGASYDNDNDVYIPQRGNLYSARNSDFM